MTVFHSPNSITARAAELLAALGTSQAQVARRLFEGGHVGRRENCGACPVAVYLMRSDLALHCVAVGNEEVTLWPGDDPDDRLYVNLPEPVAELVYEFDLGGYAELVAGGAA